MNKGKSLSIKYLIAAALLIVLFIIDFRYCLSVLLGTLAYQLNFRFIEYRYNNLLDSRKLKTVLLSFLGILLLSSSLLIAILLPNIFNWGFVLAGILLNKYYLIYRELKGAK